MFYQLMVCILSVLTNLLLARIRSAIIAAYLLQFLLQLQLTSFPHDELWVGNASRETRLRQLVVQLLSDAAVILLPARCHHLFLFLL